MTIQENIFMKIAQALLVDYTSVYYVNATTNEYCWYSMDPRLRKISSIKIKRAARQATWISLILTQPTPSKMHCLR